MGTQSLPASKRWKQCCINKIESSPACFHNASSRNSLIDFLFCEANEFLVILVSGIHRKVGGADKDLCNRVFVKDRLEFHAIMINHGRKGVKSVFQKGARRLLFAPYFILKISDANQCKTFLQVLLHTASLHLFVLVARKQAL